MRNDREGFPSCDVKENTGKDQGLNGEGGEIEMAEDPGEGGRQGLGTVQRGT